MINWKIIVSSSFKKEMRNIYKYISEILLEPKIATEQTKRIFETIMTLNYMPKRHSLAKIQPWPNSELRKIMVDNFIIFYLIDEKIKQVMILHIFYNGQDVEKIFLKK